MITFDELKSRMTPESLKLRELKARKAKFGFQYDSIQLHDIQFLAEILNALASNPHVKYEYRSNAGSYPTLNIYTDDELSAEMIRNAFC